MTPEQFSEVFHTQMRLCEDVLIDKAREYATADRLHNFKLSAELQGISPRQALAGMMAKHTVSLYDMCRSDQKFPLDKWDEKIVDHINYLILLSAIILDDEMPGMILPLNPIDEFMNSIEEKNA